MYLNSNLNQPVWICIVQSLEKQAKMAASEVSGIKKEEKNLKIIRKSKRMDRKIKKMVSEKSFEITYIKAWY